MANSPGADSSGGSFGITAGMEDLLATSGYNGTRQKEPLIAPNAEAGSLLLNPMRTNQLNKDTRLRDYRIPQHPG